jgi:hypothetical protein
MSNDRWRVWGISLAIVGLVVAVYFPVYHAHFVWDDRIYLHDTASLRSGSGLMQRIFGAIFDSADYFRPLAIALFTAETTLFDVAPGPAHLLSLAIHGVNTLCVGALARRIASDRAANAPGVLPYAAMLLFGLHPLLIEPVAWISGQFDLLVTLFILLGLLTNLSLQGIVPRSLAVAMCFLFAAGAKESAVAFPFLLLISDWLRTKPATPARVASLQLLKRQWPAYASVLAAGILYLLLRHWSLGSLVQSPAPTMLGAWPHLQLVCFTYFSYWRVIVWPMASVGPLHIVPQEQFAAVTFASVAVDAAALGIFVLGVWLLWRRKALGGLIIGATATLLPVLHLLPVDFDDSYYHDRYAMTAIAIVAAYLPAAIMDLEWQRKSRRRVELIVLPAALLWLVFAVLNIRVTIPLWADEILFWQWALRQHPDAIAAKDSLLSLYLAKHDLAHARPLAEDVTRTAQTCATCMLNVAGLAILDGDANAAAAALGKAKQATRYRVPSRVQMVAFILTTGDMKRLQGDLAGAEEAYRDAISLGPEVPGSRMSLAVTLASLGKFVEARQVAEEGLALFAPDDRAVQRRQFESLLAAAQSGAQKTLAQ